MKASPLEKRLSELIDVGVKAVIWTLRRDPDGCLGLRSGRHGGGGIWARWFRCCVLCDFGRQVAPKNDVSLGNHESTLDDIFQLPDVSRPSINFQSLQGILVNGFLCLLVYFGELSQKVMNQQGDVLLSVPQGG